MSDGGVVVLSALAITVPFRWPDPLLQMRQMKRDISDESWLSHFKICDGVMMVCFKPDMLSESRIVASACADMIILIWELCQPSRRTASASRWRSASFSYERTLEYSQKMLH